MIQTLNKLSLFFLFGLFLSLNCFAQQSNLTAKEFTQLALKDSDSAQSKTLWLDKLLQQKTNDILDHDYPKLRLRYWQSQTKNNAIEQFQTLWFLDEIGKEKPISFGISIINDKVDLIRVLTFRESRGGEIQMQVFSDQFNDLSLNEENQLDANIDGITGATMSVTAMKKITRMALMLHQHVQQQDVKNTEL